MSTGRDTGSRLIERAPGAVRFAGGVWWRATKWSANVTARTGSNLARVAADPALVGQLVAMLGSQMRDYARALLGITDLDERVRQLGPPVDDARADNGTVSDDAELRVKGALLLRAAAELESGADAHPAYARILTELAPDEGRILRLLATDGSQPSVDVRASSVFGVGSQLVAGGLNMIGAQAGCANRARVPAYLNNLERLGLIWFSREPLEDPIAYQVLEAQPEVMDALKGGHRAKTVQRSIQLTPFGRDFCDVCLPLDEAEAEALAREPGSDLEQ
jgi:Abortive infection alpha